MTRFYISLILLAAVVIAVIVLGRGPVMWWLLGLTFLGYAVVFGLGVAILSWQFFIPVIYRGRTREKRVSLTFDDGPDPVGTAAVLDVLAHRNVKAAFFCVGRRVAAHPELIRRIVDDGHLVSNHSDRHRWWTNFLWGRRLDDELCGGQDAVYRIIGKRPAFYRPPVGLSNPHLGKALKKNGLICVGWDVRPMDTAADVETVKARIMRKVRHGSIIVLHDAGPRPETIGGLVEEVISELHERGFTLIGLDELIGRSGYQAE